MFREDTALDEIKQAFGDNVIAEDGSLNRARLREIVFADVARRDELEEILHPRIRDHAFQQAASAAGPYVIVVVPLLFESPMKQGMNRILVVDCDEATQLRRLTARDNESEAQARRIIAAQASRAERLSIADDVIKSEGSLADTRAAVEALHEFYLELVKVPE